MRHLILIKVDSTGYEAGEPPPPALQAAMGELIGRWTEQGALLAAEGLRPPSEGKRVRIGKGKVTVTDGPFSEAKEVIGGFFLVKTATADEALALTREVVDLHLQVLGPEFVLECELRRLDGDAS
jgi:hypothetical protein